MSARTKVMFDRGGSLLAFDVPIGRLEITPWKGRDIMGRERGLDPDREYLLLDDPREFERAVDSGAFDGIPLTIGHARPVSPIGEISNVWMDGAFIRADVEVAAWGAVDSIRSGARRQLSISFLGDIDMTPGSVITDDGRRLVWDGVTRNVRGDHCALVRAGKSGPDCAINI